MRALLSKTTLISISIAVLLQGCGGGGADGTNFGIIPGSTNNTPTSSTSSTAVGITADNFAQIASASTTLFSMTAGGRNPDTDPTLSNVLLDVLFNIENTGLTNPNCSYDIISDQIESNSYTINIANCTAFGATINGAINVTSYTTRGTPQPIKFNTQPWVVSANMIISTLEFRVNNKTTAYTGRVNFDASYAFDNPAILQTSFKVTSNLSVNEARDAIANGTATGTLDELRDGFTLTSTYDASSQAYSLEASGDIVSRVTASEISIATTLPFQWILNQANPTEGDMNLSDPSRNLINITGGIGSEVQVNYNGNASSFNWL